MDTKCIVRPCHFYVEKFRGFQDVSLDLGRRMTVISGQNGVGKSNLLSLIASGSGLSKKSLLGSNFQPEFYDFFNIDKDEDYEDYKLYLQYVDSDDEIAFTKRLSFKNDIVDGRGIRVIPRTSNYGMEACTLKEAEKAAKEKYGVGGAARVRIPTIYLSLSRLYPLGEKKETVSIKTITKKNVFYQKRTDEKFKEWYNMIVPNAIKNEASLSVVKKGACSRASLHMDIVNTPTLSQSIGQDNVGNIVSALVDIYILSLEDDYCGALLCIDEIDVSLHPDTQIRLLDLLDKLAEELQIQIVVSTHSLTVLKETLKKEKNNSREYSVVYIKNPVLPYITKSNSYELLKADMFGNLSFDRPKVKMYFEDNIGKELFRILIKAYRTIVNNVGDKYEEPILRNSSDVPDFKEINDRIRICRNMAAIEDDIKQIPTTLGCEQLIKMCEVDGYFKRVIFMLDGDARYKEPSQKPKIREYLTKKYDQKEFSLNDRNHTQNICFFPDYFAPESYLYAIIYNICEKPIENAMFWRALDQNEETSLYTVDKIKNIFASLPSNFNNDDLKKIFKDSFENEIWKFVITTDIVTYYYSDYTTVDELLCFIEYLKKAYQMTMPLTISNKYI